MAGLQEAQGLVLHPMGYDAERYNRGHRARERLQHCCSEDRSHVQGKWELSAVLLLFRRENN